MKEGAQVPLEAESLLLKPVSIQSSFLRTSKLIVYSVSTPFQQDLDDGS